MALVEPSIICAPSLATPASAQQGGIIVADNDCLVNSSLRKTVAFERTSSTILRFRIEKAAVFNGACGSQGTPPRALQAVVLSVVMKASERYTTLDWLGLGWDQ